MRYQSVSVHNYKSILDLGPITLGPGFNVIVGPNNAGKTALLEALSQNIAFKPHRTLATVPRPTAAPDSRTWVDFEFEFTEQEMADVLAGTEPVHLYFAPADRHQNFSAPSLWDLLGKARTIRLRFDVEGPNSRYRIVRLPSWDPTGIDLLSTPEREVRLLRYSRDKAPPGSRHPFFPELVVIRSRRLPSLAGCSQALSEARSTPSALSA